MHKDAATGLYCLDTGVKSGIIRENQTCETDRIITDMEI